jgi:hypothetical protein
MDATGSVGSGGATTTAGGGSGALSGAGSGSLVEGEVIGGASAGGSPDLDGGGVAACSRASLAQATTDQPSRITLSDIDARLARYR